jgi:hypothetical protein
MALSKEFCCKKNRNGNGTECYIDGSYFEGDFLHGAKHGNG